MTQRRPSLTMTFIFWGSIALIIVGYGALCVYDGWFHEGYPDAEVNKWMAAGCLLAVAWVVSQGVKEYKKVKRLLEQQGDATPTAEPSPSQTQHEGAAPDEADKEN